MPKNRNRDSGLADYAVHLHGHHPLKIRATSLIVVDKWLYLRDAAGGVLFAAPEMNLHYVKLLEPAEELAPPERLPIPGFEFEAEPVAADPEPAVADPGPIETAGTFGPFAQIEPVPADPEPAVDARGRKHGTGGRFTKA